MRNDYPRPFQNEVIEQVFLHLPEHCSYDARENEIVVDLAAVLECARNEGYVICNYVPTDPTEDKYCVHGYDDSIKFFQRQYFKGKPGRDFKLHRDVGPAMYSEFEVSWHKNGEYHRDNDLPALVGIAEVCWVNNGRWHRNNGPAMINSYRGIYGYNNHEAAWRIIRLNGETVKQNFAGWENGIGKWVAE